MTVVALAEEMVRYEPPGTMTAVWIPHDLTQIYSCPLCCHDF